ncbi:COPII coat GTPase [Sorochytrium milnesiophthora]
MASLKRLPTVKDIIRIYGLRAQAELSQNFILDQNVTDKIASLVNRDRLPWDDSLVVEVGPGPGLLTRSLIQAGAKRMVVVEKDARFLPTLQQLAEATGGEMKIIHGDVLKTPHEHILAAAGRMPKRIHIVGNLPFSVATPLLFSLLEHCFYRRGLFAGSPPPVDMTLMFQHEVAARITAPVSTPSRSRISVMAQAVCDVDYTYTVPAKVFVPKPKVDAGVVTFRPLVQSMLQDVPLEALETAARFAFSTRRKIVKNALSMHISEQDTVARLLDASGIDGQLRAQDISTEAFFTEAGA